MNYKIRKIKNNEIGILEDFLYESIFIPEGIEKPNKDIMVLCQLVLVKNKQ